MLRRDLQESEWSAEKVFITDPFFCIHTPAGHRSFWRSKRVSAAAVLDYTVHRLGGAALLPVSFHTEPPSLPELLRNFRQDWTAFAPCQPGCQQSQTHTVLCRALPRAAGAAASLHSSSLRTACRVAFYCSMTRCFCPADSLLEPQVLLLKCCLACYLPSAASLAPSYHQALLSFFADHHFNLPRLF